MLQHAVAGTRPDVRACISKYVCLGQGSKGVLGCMLALVLMLNLGITRYVCLGHGSKGVLGCTLALVLMLNQGITRYVCLGRGSKGVLGCMQAMAAACDMFTGAELAGLCREAAITALREDLQVAHLAFLALSWNLSLVVIGLLYMP
jgi:hypothetical protein